MVKEFFICVKCRTGARGDPCVASIMCYFVFADKNIKISKAVEIDQSLRNKIQNLENDIDNYEKDLNDAAQERDGYKSDVMKMTAEIESLVEEKKQLIKQLEDSKNKMDKFTKELGKIVI